jgi:predicted NBD/HSP70 family sugar kinase
VDGSGYLAGRWYHRPLNSNTCSERDLKNWLELENNAEKTTMKHVSEKKERDRSVIEALVWKHGPISRAEIRQLTHLRWSVISDIVRELLIEGKVLEVGRSSNPLGRKQTLLRLNAEHGFIAVVKFDAESVCAAVTDLFPEIRSKTTETTRTTGGVDGLIGQLLSCTHEAIRQAGMARDRILGIGIADPGLVNVREGISVLSTTLDFWKEVPLKRIFEEQFGLPVVLESNTRAQALAERVLGAGADAEDMIYIDYGKGVGAGITIEGRMLRGHNWIAGEFGHIPVVENGPACTCGSFGCLEAVAGLSAIEARCRKAIQEGSHSRALELANGIAANITGWTVLQAAKLGDKTCVAIVEELAKFLGLGLSTLVNLFNPAIVILDDRLASAGDGFLEQIARAVRKQALGPSTSHLKFCYGKLGSDGCLLGAALNVLEKTFEIPALKPPHFMVERSVIDDLAAQRRAWADRSEQTGTHGL